MTVQRIAIHGAAGRMGRRLVALSAADPDIVLAAALERPQHSDLGKDAGAVAGVEPTGVPLTAALSVPVDVVIDFSVPEEVADIVACCLQRRAALVMATTGLASPERDSLTRAAQQIAIVWAPNMSLAVNLAMKMAATAAQVLKDYPTGADVEIIERHHRFKEDAPSGTALKFGEIVAGVMGQSQHTHGRQGRAARRPAHEIGYHALRVGDDPGQHTVVFGLLGETLELTVRATNRDCYALGALAAAKFVANKPPGIYTMYDVLGL